MSPEAFRLALAGLDRPDRLGWGVSGPADPAMLHPLEAKAIARAIPARQAEFAGGRVAAREALAALGFPSDPVPMRPDRAPLWPVGIAGSITHCDGLCVAVAVTALAARGIGLDIEPLAPLPPDLMDEITRSDEDPGADPLMTLRRRFSAKEAVYKAQYAVTGQLFGFHALHVDLAAGRARFPDHPETDPIPDDFRRQGLAFRQWSVGGLILSLCMIPA